MAVSAVNAWPGLAGYDRSPGRSPFLLGRDTALQGLHARNDVQGRPLALGTSMSMRMALSSPAALQTRRERGRLWTLSLTRTHKACTGRPVQLTLTPTPPLLWNAGRYCQWVRFNTSASAAPWATLAFTVKDGTQACLRKCLIGKRRSEGPTTI